MCRLTLFVQCSVKNAGSSLGPKMVTFSLLFTASGCNVTEIVVSLVRLAICCLTLTLTFPALQIRT